MRKVTLIITLALGIAGIASAEDGLLGEPGAEPMQQQQGCVDPRRDAAQRASRSAGFRVDPAGASTEVVRGELVVQFEELCGNAPSCGAWVYAPATGCSRFVRYWERPSY